MDINNVTQFANFLTINDLANLDGTFSHIVQCINNYATTCNCNKSNDKLRLYTTCNRLYMDATRYCVPKHKNAFLSKTSERQINFKLDNGSVIITISR